MGQRILGWSDYCENGHFQRRPPLPRDGHPETAPTVHDSGTSSWRGTMVGSGLLLAVAAVYETADKATNMPIDDTSPKKVRQLVIRRLRGMLNGLERARRQPNRREAYYMSQAMECLREDRLPESEQAVTSAAQLSPLPPDFAKRTESNQSPNLVQLRQALDQLEID